MIIERIMNIRDMGKSIFFDAQSKRQYYINSKMSCFELSKTLTRGTLINVKECESFVTKSGEPSFRLLDFEVDNICLKELPLIVKNDSKTYNALSLDSKRNNRVLDLITDESSFNTLKTRFAVTQDIRKYFNDSGALEVETPILQPIYGGANATPFITKTKHNDTIYYLRISPELYLKRLMISGFDFVYEIAKCFRNEGIDATHNPEFTLLEVYKSGETYQWGYETTIALINKILETNYTPIIVDYIQSVNAITNAENLSIEQIVDIFENEVEPSFKSQDMIIVKNHPVEISPLAYSTNGITADRFELYLNGIELANGYTEQNDVSKQLLGFTNTGNIDECYLNDLSFGLPTTCGIGIGIDRLIMFKTQSNNIKDVISFIK